MLKQEFDEALAKFKSITSWDIPWDQRDAWWLKLKDRDGGQFIEVCESFACTEERIPPLSKILVQMNQLKSGGRVHCPRCDGTGIIPFFFVHTITTGNQKYKSGSFSSARCSCEAGDALCNKIERFDDIPEFQNEPERTHGEYGQRALAAEDRWLRAVHQPRLPITPGNRPRDVRADPGPHSRSAERY